MKECSTGPVFLFVPTAIQKHVKCEKLAKLPEIKVGLSTDIAGMNNILQIEREVSNNLRIENIQLKAKIGELKSYKVNSQNQCLTYPALESLIRTIVAVAWLLSQMNQCKSTTFRIVRPLLYSNHFRTMKLGVCIKNHIFVFSPLAR